MLLDAARSAPPGLKESDGAVLCQRLGCWRARQRGVGAFASESTSVERRRSIRSAAFVSVPSNWNDSPLCRCPATIETFRLVFLFCSFGWFLPAKVRWKCTRGTPRDSPLAPLLGSARLGLAWLFDFSDSCRDIHPVQQVNTPVFNQYLF